MYYVSFRRLQKKPALKIEFPQPFQSDLPCPALRAKIFLFPFFRNHAYIPPILIPLRGASRPSRTLETGSGGRDGLARRARWSRTSEGVWSWPPDAEVKPAGDELAGDGG